MPDQYTDYYKSALEGKKTQIVELGNQVLSLLHAAKDPNSKQNFKDACAGLRKAIGDAQGFFDPKTPNDVLSKMDAAVSQIDRAPEQYGSILQLAEMMHEVPHIPHGNLSLEDKLKQLVDHNELQDKIDQLHGEIKRLVDDYSNDIQYKLMTEIQRLGEALLGARKKSLLEVFATSGGIATVIGVAGSAFTGTLVGPVLFGIMQTALEIHSWARDKQDDCMLSYLDGLNVRMPMGKSMLDRSDSRPNFLSKRCLRRNSRRLSSRPIAAMSLQARTAR